MPTLAKVLFIVGLLLSLSGYVSPPVALTAGILFGLSFTHPYISESRGVARILLQSSVVALGFGMNLHEVLRAGQQRVSLHRAGNFFRTVAGRSSGQISPGSRQFFVSDYDGHGHLRRERNCRNRSDCGS